MNSPVSSGRIDELPRIVDQLRRAFEGDAWHGPSVLEALTGINAKMAAAKPIPTAHSIWEIVEHIGAWDDAIRQRLNGRALQLSPEQDWPAISDSSNAAWINSIDTLKKRHSDLCSAISAMPEQRLLAPVPGKDYDFYHMLHGAVQHALYHAGQIVLLKKSSALAAQI